MLAYFGILTASSQRQIPTPQLQNGKPVPQLVTTAQHLMLSQADQNPRLRYPILKPVKSYQKETLQQVPKQLKRRTAQTKPLQQFVKRADDTNNIMILGTVLSRPSWGDYEETSDVPFGVFSFDTDPDNNTIAYVKQNSAFFANGGAAFYNGRFHYITYENLWGYLFGTLSIYDMNNWSCLTSKAAINRDFITTASAYDPTSGYVYGCTYNQDMDGMELAAFDYESQSRKLICKIDSDVTALACNKAGELFEITGNGYLAKVNKATGQLTNIGYTGVTPDPYLQSAAIDPATGKMYWAAMVDGAQSRLYLVDTATGEATLIKEFADAPEFGSLYIPEVKTGAEPETVSDLNVSFANGEVTGDVTFTLPSKSVAGNVLSGNLDYYILCGGDTLCTSTGTPGLVIKKTLTLKAGANIILVFCKNDNGESERARKYLYTGYDQPMAISNIALTYDGYEAKLTWRAPTATTHNGYLDTKSLTYNVVRYPQGDTVATGLKNTSFTETLPSDTLQHYHYTVTAVNYVTESDPTESNSVLIGKPFELPYTDDFESGNLNNYSTIDPSKSGYDWEVTTDYDNEDAGNVLLYSNYYCYDTANNWIVLPPINLKADNVTMLTFKAHTGDWDNSLNEKLNVMIGRNEDTKLFKKVQSFTVSSYNFSTFTVPVIVSEDGTYRIALQCVSDASSYGI